LSFGHFFDRSLRRLPATLQHLTFGFHFNQSLENTELPNSLRTLTFGNCFNQSLEGVTLPSSLKSLRFGDAFNRSLEGVKLPDSLEDLAFGRAFDQSLAEVPSSLQSLRLGVEFRFQENLGASLPICSLFHRDLRVSRSGVQENSGSGR
jgi:hypothetical protein